MTSVHEIELKALLTEDQYNALHQELPQRMQLTNDESMHTYKFESPDGKDLRIRYTDKQFEIVCKKGTCTDVSRREGTIQLTSREEAERVIQLFRMIGFKESPSWITQKRELQHEFNGFTYNVCLQNIENFACILEVEFVSKEDVAHIHEPNIRAIIKELGHEPVNPEEFGLRIKKYIEENKKK